jgi:oxaloacetate decarboxylase
MMNVAERRQRLRAVLTGDECVYAAPVHDPISARIADDLGFEIGFMANNIPLAVVGGFPPAASLLTLTEQAQHVRNMCRASDLSLMVGVNDGYGHALNVMRTVEELENAGASAIRIEDTFPPLRFGDSGTPLKGLPRGEPPRLVETTGPEYLVPLDEMVGRLKAALAARQDPNLAIVPRSFALRNQFLAEDERWPEFIRRLQAFEEAGVDALFVTVRTREQIEAIQGVTKLPLIGGHAMTMNVVGTLPQHEGAKYLASKGFRLVNPSHLTMWAAAKASRDVLMGLRDGTPLDELRAAWYEPEWWEKTILRKPHYDELVKKFMN